MIQEAVSAFLFLFGGGIFINGIFRVHADDVFVGSVFLVVAALGLGLIP